MMAFPPKPRYERKFIAQGLMLAEVLALVRRHPALFRETYPGRAVNNIYLDSPGLRDYFDHINGIANRAKTRIRWYGPLSGRLESPALERKIKRGLVSGKVAHRLPPLSINGGVPRDLRDAMPAGADMPELVRSTLRALEPSLVNRYFRRYYLSADGRFRLTVDTDLEFYPPCNGARTMSLTSPDVPRVILELKYDPAYAEQVERVTNELPFRMTRCSKYVLGIQQVAGG